MKQLLSTVLCILGATPALAQSQADSTAQSSPIELHGSAAVASDYVWRGISQTDRGPAYFATITAKVGGAYLGVGTENVDFSGISTEYDIWGGYVFTMGNVSLDLGASFYGYVDAPTKIDTLEWKAGLAVNKGKASFGPTIYYTANYFGTDQAAVYGEVAASYGFSDKLVGSGAVGLQNIAQLPDYTTWNLGLTYFPVKHLKVDVRYHHANDRTVDPARVSKVVGTLTGEF